MKELVEHILNEVKAKTISKPKALGLLRQLHTHCHPTGGQCVLHPLVQTNSADFEGLRYTSSFTGSEFFLEDHRVQGQRVMPGVAYLEMARAAAMMAAGPTEDITITLRNVLWPQPWVANEQAAPIHIGLAFLENGAIGFDAYSENDKLETLHCQGELTFDENAESPALFDIEVLLKSCNAATLSKDECYKVFESLGTSYGPAHQSIEDIYVGEGQLLAKLRLPTCVAHGSRDFLLHPSILDAALQACLGMQAAKDGFAPMPHAPISLEAIQLYASTCDVAWAYIRQRHATGQDEKSNVFDIGLCDAQGHVSATITGMEFMVINLPETGTTKKLQADTYFYRPTEVSAQAHQHHQREEGAQHVVMLDKPLAKWENQIKACVEGVKTAVLKTGYKQPVKQYENYALQLFEEVKSLLEAHQGEPMFVQIILQSEDERPLRMGLNALLKSAKIENPFFSGQAISIVPGISFEAIKAVVSGKAYANVQQLRYRDTTPLCGSLEAIASPSTYEMPWRDNGVYLITGGLGTLGQHFAKEIAQHTKNATLLLLGRTPANNPDVEAKLGILQAFGASVSYHTPDLAKKQTLSTYIEKLAAKHGAINGVLHIAGAVRENFIINKSKEEVRQVFEAKVHGTTNLDHATKDMKLDFFVMFSTGAALMGGEGLGGYSMANAFMDQFAFHRQRWVDDKERQGLSLSINWPLWEQVGLQVRDDTNDIIAQQTGFKPLNLQAGLQAFYQCLALNTPQVAVLHGNLEKIKEAIVLHAASKPTLRKKKAHKADESIKKQSMALLKKQIATVTKLSEARIEEQAHFDTYGLDSIHSLQLINGLEKYFGPLPKTLTLEFPNLVELSEYFAINFPEIVSDAQQQKTSSGNNGQAMNAIGQSPAALCLRPKSRGNGHKAWPTGDSSPTTSLIHAFPELIRLNNAKEGKPIFWFHAGAGGVEAYRGLAESINRPFYGIQARGYMTSRQPLQGIQAMAAYYTHIILSTQPFGTYDLGGYSLGGMIAYETARQLQELDREVGSVVLLDSLIDEAMKKAPFNRKDALLQAVNMSMFSSIAQSPEKFASTLVHRDEAGAGHDEKALIEVLVSAAQGRGINKDKAQLEAFMKKCVDTQQAFQPHLYNLVPLPKPTQFTAYYFKNTSGLFVGDLAPYFILDDERSPYDHIDYWRGWEEYLPTMKTIDVAAENHMMLLSDPEVYQTILSFCARLYGGKPITGRFLKDLQLRQKMSIA